MSEQSTAAPASEETLRLRVMTPRSMVFDGDVQRLRVSSLEGLMELLPRHEAIMAPLAIAPLEINLPGDETPVPFAVLGGFLDHDGEKTVILADAAEKGADIDIERAQEAMRRARERLEEAVRAGDAADVGVDTDRARLALLRSLTRLQASGNAHHQA